MHRSQTFEIKHLASQAISTFVCTGLFLPTVQALNTWGKVLCHSLYWYADFTLSDCFSHPGYFFQDCVTGTHSSPLLDMENSIMFAGDKYLCHPTSQSDLLS